MKTKSLLIALAVCLALSSIVYSGSIVNSKHDLQHAISTNPALMSPFLNNYGEVCIYCHTPHGSGSIAPLWNKSTPAGPYNVYTSSTMDSTTGNPPSGVSLACLSCHDGTTAVDAIVNAPGTGANINGPWYGVAQSGSHFVMTPGTSCGSCHNGSVGHNANNAYLGTDLTNDHPISMTYPATSDFNSPTDALKGWGGSSPSDIKLFSGKVECASCHNVHDPAVVPFLRISNTNSDLCKKCHVK